MGTKTVFSCDFCGTDMTDGRRISAFRRQDVDAADDELLCCAACWDGLDFKQLGRRDAHPGAYVMGQSRSYNCPDGSSTDVYVVRNGKVEVATNIVGISYVYSREVPHTYVMGQSRPCNCPTGCTGVSGCHGSIIELVNKPSVFEAGKTYDYVILQSSLESGDCLHLVLVNVFIEEFAGGISVDDITIDSNLRFTAASVWPWRNGRFVIPCGGNEFKLDLVFPEEK